MTREEILGHFVMDDREVIITGDKRIIFVDLKLDLPGDDIWESMVDILNNLEDDRSNNNYYATFIAVDKKFDKMIPIGLFGGYKKTKVKEASTKMAEEAVINAAKDGFWLLTSK